MPAPHDRMAEHAKALQAAALADGLPQLLRGRHFGLLSLRPDSAEASAFEEAVGELGGLVSRIRPSITGLLLEHNAAATARWLGRLYDAIECQELPHEVVERIRQHAGVPVLQALPTGVLSLALHADGLLSHRRLVQARVVAAFE